MRFPQRQARVNVIQAETANNEAIGNSGLQNGALIIREKTRSFNNDSNNHNNATKNNNDQDENLLPYLQEKRSFDTRLQIQ